MKAPFARALTAMAVLLAAVGCDADEAESGDAAPAAADGTPTTDVDPAADGAPTADATAGDLTRCEIITRSVAAAGFAVQVDCDDTYAWLAADTYPDHEVMTGIVGTNEQIAVPAFDYASPVRLEPARAADYTTIDAAVAVAINGVPIYDYTAAGELDPAVYDPRVDTVTTGQLDVCNGHAGRGDDYHYHAAPTCMIEAMPNRDDNPIIGWGFDGYPLYGNDNPDGTAIPEGTLGLCNEQADATFGWRYHTSDAPPYIIQCLIGEVDDRVLPRVPPLRAAAGSPEKPSGTPPQGGVDDLVLTRTGDARSMTYSYRGADYFINYAPAADPGCYDFEWSTVSYGADSGTYCR